MARMWGDWNPCALPVRRENGFVNAKNGSAVSQKVTYGIAVRPSNSNPKLKTGIQVHVCAPS